VYGIIEALTIGDIMKNRHRMDYPVPQLTTQKSDKKAVFVMDETPEGLAKDKALFDAFMQEDVEAVKQLLQSENGVRGANPNVKDELGRTLYHLAKRWGWHEIKGVLHQHGGRVIHDNPMVHYYTSRVRTR